MAKIKGGQRCPLKYDGSFFRIIQRTQNIHQRRFTGSGTSAEHRKFSLWNLDIDIMQCNKLAAGANWKCLLDMVRLFSIIGIVIVVCMVVLGKLISKINISQALKLGED